MPMPWFSPRKRPKPLRSRTPSSCLAVITAVTVLFVPAFLGSSSRLHPSRVFQFPLPVPRSLCLAVTHPNSPPWRFNSRSLCLSSSLCLSTRKPHSAFFHAADRTSTRCAPASPDWTALPIRTEHGNDNVTSHFDSCTDFEHGNIICAHGPGLEVDNPRCPELVVPMKSGYMHNAEWVEDVTIVVPAYPWPENIFHFANVMTSLTAIVHALPTLLHDWGPSNLRAPGGFGRYFDYGTRPRRLNILFKGRKILIDRNIWQTDLLNLTLSHALPSSGIAVTARWLVPETEGPNHLCIRNAILMGKRGNINVFPFANSTEVPVDGRSVPWDAVLFKKAVYAAYGIQRRLPEGQYGVVELPPLTVGYAKRAGERSRVGWNVLPQGIFRRFSPTDEQWFQNMLREETDYAGVGLRIFTTTAEEPLRDQVTNIAKVGFVVGIHGANLVNSMFMNPFGALFEIAPATSLSPCYIGGMNSGLAYMRHESSQIATPEESGCTQWDKECQQEERYRRVKLGAKLDRDRVRQLVQNGIRHLKDLHVKYPRGIPVVFNKYTATYDIEERR